jgi:hypothetical protein
VSALDELATYLGHPDRPFDARALELVTQAVMERNADLPHVGHLGDDLDMPFEHAAPGSTVDLADAVIAGGWTVAGAVLPVPEVGLVPALVFRFHRYDGHILRPVVLAMAEDQTRKAADLLKNAAGAAIRACRGPASTS